ncbi:MAG: hypothetical protein GF364_13025 [Candidatus Lokiarchaeota archaeon]|nr:hypothetical protein [Candidatus Lokiarchaeota archaeon]
MNIKEKEENNLTKTKFIPFAQLKRIISESIPSDFRISEEAIIELEQILIQITREEIEQAKRYMKASNNRITLYPEDLFIENYDKEETVFFKTSIDKMIRSMGIERIRPSAAEKMQKYLENLAVNIALESKVYADHSGRLTIQSQDIKLGLKMSKE